MNTIRATLMLAIKRVKQSNYKILAMEFSKKNNNIPSICKSHVKIWQQTALSVEKLFVLEIHTMNFKQVNTASFGLW